jgi:hypothetical protein
MMINEIANAVRNEEVHFLHMRGPHRWDPQLEIRLSEEGGQRTTILSIHEDNGHIPIMSRIDGIEEVF